MYYIYALLDDCEIFYIGQCLRPHVRYLQHIQKSLNSKSSNKDYYIKWLLENDHQIGMTILAKCNDRSTANLTERYFAQMYKNAGANLINNRLTTNRKIPRKHIHQLL